MAQREFDMIVVGGGTGRDVVLAAEARGLRVALIERGPLGGTCHNRGCMPSKMLIHSADVAATVEDAGRFGVDARLEGIDFPAIVHNVFHELDDETREREASLRASDLVTFYQSEARFSAPRTLVVAGDTVTAPRVVIAAGTRPTTPPLPGSEGVPYLTSDDALRLDRQPQRLVIVGGGYIAVELAHFFGGLGTEVTLLLRGRRLLDREDGEIADWLTREYAARFDLRVGVEVAGLERREGAIVVALSSGGSVAADQLLLATGRRPNSDALGLEAAGVTTDARGYIEVNDRYETAAEGVWAFGDITGRLELKHVAVRQARLLVRGLFEDEWRTLNYDSVPHAVFSSPQVAAVGRTEEQLQAAGTPYRVGRHEFRHTGMGMALKEHGLVKVLASPEGRILGCHIVGPNASVLIQEPVVAMNTTGMLDAIIESVHAHPALPQVVEEACKAAAAA